MNDAERIFNAFWDSSPPLKLLKQALTRYWKSNNRKFIKGLDGRKIFTRSEHSLVNYLFQSAGIICMKQAMVLWDKWIREEGIDAHQVIHYHDEAQAEDWYSNVITHSASSVEDLRSKFGGVITTKPKEEAGIYTAKYCRSGELGVLSIVEAGKHFNLNVELGAEYKIGHNWSDTH